MKSVHWVKSLKSAPDHFGLVAIVLHWTIALLVLGLLCAGAAIAAISDQNIKISLLRLHAPLGSLTALLTIARIAWWMLFDKQPLFPASEAKFQEVAARVVQLLLNLAVLFMVFSGIATLRMSRAADIIFQNAPGSLPDFELFWPHAAHGLCAFLLVILIIGHAGAALYHKFIQKDGMVERMLPWR